MTTDDTTKDDTFEDLTLAQMEREIHEMTVRHQHAHILEALDASLAKDPNGYCKTAQNRKDETNGDEYDYLSDDDIHQRYAALVAKHRNN